MIGKGAQYLTAAGFGRYRITAASLGSNRIMPVWLFGATKQAIMDAFGVDGPAVIAATNEYLNGIAASDYAKATALAGFINEDPMMVCSLGLEPQGVTMPKRYLVGDGKVWFETGITTEYYNMRFNLQVRMNKTLSGEYEMFGNYSGNNAGLTAGHYVSGGVRAFMYARGGNSNVAVADVYTFNQYEFIIDANNNIFSTDCNGTSANRAVSYSDYARNTTIRFMDGQTFNINKGFYDFAHFEMRYGSDGHKHFVPFILGQARTAEQVYPQSSGAQAVGTKGMLEIESGIFYPNQGTGTPTIPDISYTPPTP